MFQSHVIAVTCPSCYEFVIMGDGADKALKKKHVAAYFALASMLCQIVISAFFMPAMASSRHAAGPLETIVLCTANGLVTTAVDENGIPIDTPVPAAEQDMCPVCSLVSAHNAIEPLDFRFAQPDRRSAKTTVLRSQFHPCGANLLVVPARGPPLLQL